ncbi:MAG: hypothetical protein F6K23_28455 [Okeania sp. SIO2C9]|uniref:hypothetical protein n=1 Tax=Okeania sp. SIO2C9 TaxID=2607791 RepID=UPI0013C26080|nr:hypothetical protein [Okeania sp. SIO2C9]NEQ76623.1 hypothetical protein [Okeania sp. SIO2C9]
METVYLHIGLNKVGSTSLQNFLSKNRDILLSHGYLYPITGTLDNKRTHHNLAWSFPNHFQKYNPQLGTWDDLFEEINSSIADKIIISSEFFNTLNESQISQLKLQLNKFKIVKIIVYIRRQDIRIKSMYKQGIKANGFSEKIEKRLDIFKSKNDYYKLLKPWRKAFGLENIILKNFDQITKSKNNLYYDFLKTLEIDRIEDFKITNIQNMSPGYKVVEVMRFMNEIIIDKLGYSKEYCLKKYKTPIMKAHFNQKFLLDDKKYDLLSTSLILSLWKEFEASNKKVSQEYLGLDNEPLFSPPSTSEREIFNIDYLTSYEWQQMMNLTLENVEKNI